MDEAWSIEVPTVCRVGMHTRHCASELKETGSKNAEVALTSHMNMLLLGRNPFGLAIMQRKPSIRILQLNE